MSELRPGIDYEPAVCDNCGKDAHTPAELAACIDSMLAPPRCPECGDPIDYCLGHGDVDEEPMCRSCNGAGETRYGEVCTFCRGRGTYRGEPEEEHFCRVHPDVVIIDEPCDLCEGTA